MNRWRVRRIYRKASAKYAQGVVAGFNDTWRNRKVSDPDGCAYSYGWNAGTDVRRSAGRLTTGMPTWVWAEVLAAAMRP